MFRNISKFFNRKTNFIVKSLSRKFSAEFKMFLNLKWEWNYIVFIKYVFKYIQLKSIYGLRTLTFGSIDFIITEKCNFRCDGCGNLINLYEKPENKNINILIKDISNFLDVVDFCAWIKPMGGETFLYPDLSILIEFLCSNDKYKNKFDLLHFITNGSIVPDEETLSMMKKYKNRMFVLISDYDIKKDELVKTLKKYDIPFKVESNAPWFHIGNLKKKNHDKNFLKEKFFECYSKSRCNFILNGKFFLCGFSAHGHQLNVFPDGEYFVDLRLMESINTKKKKIRDLLKTDYIDPCDYCGSGKDYDSEDSYMEGLTLKKNIFKKV